MPALQLGRSKDGSMGMQESAEAEKPWQHGERAEQVVQKLC